MNMKRIGFYASVSLTLAFIIMIGIFCTSSAKGAAQAASNKTEQTTSQTDTSAPDTSAPGTDAPAQTDEPGTGGDDTQSPTDTTTSAPVITDPDKEVFRPYTGTIPGEQVKQTYTSGQCTISVYHVVQGDISYYICDIKLNSASALHTAFVDGIITSRNYTSYTAKQSEAVFAVNGDFCGYHNNGIIIRNGTLYRNKPCDWDLCYVNKYGDLKVGLNNDYDGKALVADGALQSWCFGPTLVKDYKAVTDFNTPGLSRTHNEPRTAIGQVDTLHYIILVVDAVRTTVTTGGMSFAQLAETFVSLGCKTAYNFDGGGSTTLYFLGEVVNTPCNNGERMVNDIVYFK